MRAIILTDEESNLLVKTIELELESVRFLKGFKRVKTEYERKLEKLLKKLIAELIEAKDFKRK